MSALLVKPGDTFSFGGEELMVDAIRWTYGKDVTRYDISAVTQPTQARTKLPPGIDVSHVIFGNPGFKKPYIGNLVGNLRIKYRMDDYAKLYVRDPHRIRCYLLKDMGEYVTHGIELEQTHRTQPRTTTNES